MNRTIARRIATILAGPAVATGILVGTLAVSTPAEAAPTTDATKCSAMAMPQAATQTSPNMLNPLTRAAQVAAANPTPQAPTFTMTC